MNPSQDPLSPKHSPQRLNSAGVKRVNHMPLVLVCAVLTLFVLLIALVANKRAHAQEQPPETVQTKSLKKTP